MKKNISRTFKKSDKYCGVIKSIKSFFVIYIIFIIVFRIAIELLPNFRTYGSFYNECFFTIIIIILLVSICSFISNTIIIAKQNKDYKFVILLLIDAVIVVFIIFMLSSGNLTIISWTKDLHYALMNNPPSITDELKVKRYKEYIHADPVRNRDKDGSIKIVGFNEKAELKIGDKTFNVDYVGKIKKFLDTHKEGSKVKAVYMPECNILISLEED